MNKGTDSILLCLFPFLSSDSISVKNAGVIDLYPPYMFTSRPFFTGILAFSSLLTNC